MKASDICFCCAIIDVKISILYTFKNQHVIDVKVGILCSQN